MAVDLSLVIPARGNGSALDLCIKSIEAQKTDAIYEVVVSYCCNDMEVARMVKNRSSVREAVSDEYMLPGPARNLGARAATGRFLAFIDSDCTLDSGWVAAALKTLESGAVLCSGAILDLYPWNLAASADNRMQYADFPPGRPYGVSRYFPAVHIAVRREIYEMVGGFTDAPHAQDVIFTIQVAAYRPDGVIFNPNLVARHAGRGTLGEVMRHHETFGYARAIHEIQIGKMMRLISNHSSLGWALFLRRLVYITMRVIQWNFIDLPRYFLQMPFIFAGLAAWVRGYYRGVKERL